MAANRYVAYYRVSTARQGRSGLGLDAQREAVERRMSEGRSDVVAEYVEVESGRNSDRPQLAAALATCRIHRATLVIAKLDRLARNVAFVSNLLEAGVEFEACDFPQANRLTIHILAAVAEHEARMISDRTKAALSAARARGTKLGGFRGRPATNEDRAKGRLSQSDRADARATDLRPILTSLRCRGIISPSAVAVALNLEQVPAPRGGEWSAVQVQRLQARITSLQNDGRH
ncbi:recombinase family protein [Kaistia sp. MMO-174]|uniref:recombinase family protein n=1 Tax=Kaistia sp. MMO-174 TaxID=3081256 RepID=UPI003019EAAD